jgi:hypothetical protein
MQEIIWRKPRNLRRKVPVPQKQNDKDILTRNNQDLILLHIFSIGYGKFW